MSDKARTGTADVLLYDALLTEAIPDVVAAEPESQAFAITLQNQIRFVLDKTELLRIYADVDKQPDAVIDIMAAELKTQFYDPAYPHDIKADMVRSTIEYYLKAGTKSAVVEILRSIYGNSDIVEWNEYGGEPGYFRIKLDITSLRQDLDIAHMVDVVNAHKRLSAHLDEIMLGEDNTITVTESTEKQAYDLPISGITICGADPWGKI